MVKEDRVVYLTDLTSIVMFGCPWQSIPDNLFTDPVQECCLTIEKIIKVCK